MTRTEKIRKLGNAIKDYRGLYRETTGEWIYPPKYEAMSRIVVWLERLKLPVQNSLDTINNFKSIKDYKNWVQSL